MELNTLPLVEAISWLELQGYVQRRKLGCRDSSDLTLAEQPWCILCIPDLEYVESLHEVIAVPLKHMSQLGYFKIYFKTKTEADDWIEHYIQGEGCFQAYELYHNGQPTSSASSANLDNYKVTLGHEML